MIYKSFFFFFLVHTTPYVIKQKTGPMSVILKNSQELFLLKFEVPACVHLKNKTLNKKSHVRATDETSEYVCVPLVLSSQNHGALCLNPELL